MQTRQACKTHLSVSPVYKHSVFTQEYPGLPVLKKYGARGLLTGRASAVVQSCGGVLNLMKAEPCIMNNPSICESGAFEK